jgi:hypothetical protein
MRIPVLFGPLVVAIALVPTAARAGDDCCAGAPAFPRVVYGLPPAPFVIPPTGYVLDPSDAVRPFYVVNQGGPGFYAATYARPTWSEGGYAFSDAYPYAGPYSYPYAYPSGYPYSGYPYIVSYGRGLHYEYRATPAAHPAVRGDLFARPYGVPPYTAYRYRIAPSARIIHLPQG